MKLYREYLGGGDVGQTKVYGSSLEDIDKQAREAGIDPTKLQNPYQWTGTEWGSYQPQQAQPAQAPTQQNNTPIINPNASQTTSGTTSGMGRQVYQRGEDLFYSTDNGYQKIKSPDELKSLSQAGFLNTTQGYQQLPDIRPQAEQAIKEDVGQVDIKPSEQVFQRGEDLYRETESGIKKIKSPAELKRLSEQGIIDTTIGRTETGGYKPLDEYIPDRDPELEPTAGVDSLIGGTQSNWDIIFQQGFESGQTMQQNFMDSMKEQQAQALSQQQAFYEQQAKTATEGLEGIEDTKFTEMQDKYREQAEAGLDIMADKMQQLGEIKNEMTMLQSAYNETVQTTEESGITIGQARGEIAREREDYAQQVSMLNTRAATVMEQYTLAKGVVDDYFENAIDERDKKIERYQELLDNAKDAGIDIEEDKRDLIQSIIDSETERQEQQISDRDAIKDFATDPNTAEAFYRSGASLDDTYDEIVRKMQPYLGQIAQTERYAGYDTGEEEDVIGLAGDYFSDTQIAIGAAEAGMDIENFRKLPIDMANQYIKGKAGEKEAWSDAEDYVIANVEQGATNTGDMSQIYSALISPNGFGLSTSDASAIMASYGMANMGFGGQSAWIYTPMPSMQREQYDNTQTQTDTQPQIEEGQQDALSMKSYSGGGPGWTPSQIWSGIKNLFK